MSEYMTEYAHKWVVELCDKCRKIDGVTHHAFESSIQAIIVGNYCRECILYEPIYTA